MMFALNALVALLVGGLAVATISLLVFMFLSGCKLRTEMRWHAIIRLVQGLALCGFVGALFMQAFGLWIT